MDPKRLMMVRFFFIYFKKGYRLCVQSSRGDQLHHLCHRRHYYPYHHHRYHPRHRHRHRLRHLHRRDSVLAWRLMATEHETIIKPCAVMVSEFCSVLHVLWRSVTTVARCGVHVRPWLSMSLMYQRAMSVAQLTVFFLWRSYSVLLVAWRSMRISCSQSSIFLLCFFGLLCWMSV